MDVWEIVFRFSEEARNFLYCNLPGLSLGPIEFPIYWVTTVLSAGVKLLNVEIKNAWRYTRRVREVKIHHMYADREIFYAYCGNTAVDLDPLP